MSIVPVSLRLAVVLLGFNAAPAALAATYYVDPAKGRMSNPGTADQPWSTLEAVFAARKRFAGGDVILLRSGFHGSPVILGHPGRDVTIRPQSGHQPRLARLKFKDASHWTVIGLDICPQHAGDRQTTTSRVVDMMDDCSHLTLKDCHIRSVFSIAGWKEKDWTTKVGGAVGCRAPYSLISGNQIENVANGIFLFAEAHHTEVSYNVVDSVRDDGFRGNASDCRFEYNTLMNMYAINGNHDDAFQSFTQGRNGGTGTGKISNVVLRGNVFISYTDPKQPYKSIMQGIACFDGMYENWVIENNVVVTETWHGITMMGAVNCRIVNNTVIKNPINLRASVPWIRVTPHKNGTRSRGNIVRNNLTSALSANSSIGTVEHNLVTQDYTQVFLDWQNFDFRLARHSPAVDAGTKTSAPSHDADQRKRTGLIDLGAFEFGSGSGTSSPVQTPTKPESPKPPSDSGGSPPPRGNKAQTARFEVEKLARSQRGGTASAKRESGASGGGLVYFGPQRKGDYIEFTTGTIQPGTYQVMVRVKAGRNRGLAQLSVGGRKLGGTMNLHASSLRFREISLGTVTVKSAGQQKVRLTAAGKGRHAKGTLLAPDRISFVAR